MITRQSTESGTLLCACLYECGRITVGGPGPETDDGLCLRHSATCAVC